MKGGEPWVADQKKYVRGDGFDYLYARRGGLSTCGNILQSNIRENQAALRGGLTKNEGNGKKTELKRGCLKNSGKGRAIPKTKTTDLLTCKKKGSNGEKGDKPDRQGRERIKTLKVGTLVSFHTKPIRGEKGTDENPS